MTTDNQRIEKNVELINTRTKEAPSERQELSTKVLNVDDRQLDQQIGVCRHSKLKKRTQRNVESSKKLIAVHTRVTRHVLPAVRKGNMRKRPDSENAARRMPQSKMHLEFNIGRDNRVERKSLQPTERKTSGRIIRKLQQVGSSNGLQDVGDWTYWKVRPPPKRKKGSKKTTGQSNTLKTRRHSAKLILSY
jgi:hypothetical protein